MEGSQADTSLDAFRRGFKQLHPKQALLMYFSVGSFHIHSAVRFLMSSIVISPVPRLRLDIHTKKCSFIFDSCSICSCVSKTQNQLDLDPQHILLEDVPSYAKFYIAQQLHK